MSEYINKVKTADGQEFDIRDQRVQAIYTEGEKAKLARMQEVFTTQEKEKLDSTEVFTKEEKEKLDSTEIFSLEEKEKLASSASTADVEELEAEVATKASAIDVGSLQEAVAGIEEDLSTKADTSAVESLTEEVNKKASASDVTALQSNVTDLATTVAAKPSSQDVANAVNGAKSSIDGTTLVIPEGPASLPVPEIVINGVAYYHKHEFDLEAIRVARDKPFDLLTGGELSEGEYPCLVGIYQGYRTVVGLAYYFNSFYDADKALLMYSNTGDVDYTSRSFTVVDTKEEVISSRTLFLPTCSAYYGWISEDRRTFISYYNLKTDVIPEITAVRQGEVSIPIRDISAIGKQVDMGVIVIPKSITSSSCLNDVVALGLGIDVPFNGSVQYKVLFENDVFNLGCLWNRECCLTISVNPAYSSITFSFGWISAGLGYTAIKSVAFSAPSGNVAAAFSSYIDTPESDNNVITTAPPFIASQFSKYGVYSVGDYVCRGGNLIRCKKAVETSGDYDYRNWESVKLAADVTKNLLNIAPWFDSTVSYVENDLVLYDGVLYKCSNASGHTGTWLASDFTRTSLAEIIKSIHS